MASIDQSTVTIRVDALEAQAVYLVGEFNSWSTAATPMSSPEAGVWEARLPASRGFQRLCVFLWEHGSRCGRIVHPRLSVRQEAQAGQKAELWAQA